MADTKYVYTFGDGKADGNTTQKTLLGGKGANLGRNEPYRPAGPRRIHHHHRSLHLLL